MSMPGNIGSSKDLARFLTELLIVTDRMTPAAWLAFHFRMRCLIEDVNAEMAEAVDGLKAGKVLCAKCNAYGQSIREGEAFALCDGCRAETNQ